MAISQPTLSTMETNKEAMAVYQDPDKPPLEAPYLLSTMRSINIQRDHDLKMQNAWSTTYPTWKGDHAAKIAWIRNIENASIDPHKHEGIFDVRDIIKEILAQDCRTPINVQIIVTKENLVNFKIAKARGKSNIYDEPDASGTTTADAAPKNAGAKEMFVVASEKFSPTARMDMMVPRLLMSIGLPIDAEVVPALPKLSRDKNNVPNFSSEWPEFAQEGIHFPSNLPHEESAVAFEVVSLKHSKSLGEYERRLREIANSHPEENPDFILVAKNPNHTISVPISPPTRDTHYVLWYSLRIEFEHCKHHVRSGIGEIDILRWKLKKNDNDTSTNVERYNLRLEIVQAEIEYIKKIPGKLKLQRKLSRLLALTMEIKSAPEFIFACSKPQLAEKCVAEVADLWRNHLLKPGCEHSHSDAALGLAPTGQVSDGVESRKAVYILLERVEKVIEKGHDHTAGLKKKINFNWRPAASLKRPATEPLAQNENVGIGSSQPNHKIQRTSSAEKNHIGIAKISAMSGSHAVARCASLVNNIVSSISAPGIPNVHPTAAVETPLALAPVVNRAAPTTPLGVTPTARAPVVVPAAVPRVVINTATVPGTQLPPGEKGSLKGGAKTNASTGMSNLSAAAAGVLDGMSQSPPTSASTSMIPPMINAVPVSVQSVGGTIGSFVNAVGTTKIPKLAQRQSPKGPRQYVPAGVGDGNNNDNNNGDGTVARAFVRPAGRAPHDRKGARMVWDNGVWKSTTNDSEFRAPSFKPRPPKSPDAPAARPVGRAPNDSYQKPMLWDPQRNVWVSTKDPEETKPPKPRPAPAYNRDAIMQSMQLPPTKQFPHHQLNTPGPTAAATTKGTAIPAGQLETKNGTETAVQPQDNQLQVGVAAGGGETGNPAAKNAVRLKTDPAAQQHCTSAIDSNPNNLTALQNSPASHVPSNTSSIVPTPPAATAMPAVAAQQLSHADISALDAAIQPSDICADRDTEVKTVTPQLNSAATRTTVTQSEPSNTTAPQPKLPAVVVEALDDNGNNNPSSAIQMPADFPKATDPIDSVVPAESQAEGCMEVERWGDSLDVDLSKKNADGNMDSLLGGGVIPTRRMKSKEYDVRI